MLEDGSLSADQTYLKKGKMELGESGEGIGGGWSGDSDGGEAKTSRERGKSSLGRAMLDTALPLQVLGTSLHNQ